MQALPHIPSPVPCINDRPVSFGTHRYGFSLAPNWSKLKFPGLALFPVFRTLVDVLEFDGTVYLHVSYKMQTVISVLCGPLRGVLFCHSMWLNKDNPANSTCNPNYLQPLIQLVHQLNVCFSLQVRCSSWLSVLNAFVSLIRVAQGFLTDSWSKELCRCWS